MPLRARSSAQYQYLARLRARPPPSPRDPCHSAAPGSQDAPSLEEFRRGRRPPSQCRQDRDRAVGAPGTRSTGILVYDTAKPVRGTCTPNFASERCNGWKRPARASRSSARLGVKPNLGAPRRPVGGQHLYPALSSTYNGGKTITFGRSRIEHFLPQPSRPLTVLRCAVMLKRGLDGIVETRSVATGHRCRDCMHNSRVWGAPHLRAGSGGQNFRSFDRLFVRLFHRAWTYYIPVSAVSSKNGRTSPGGAMGLGGRQLTCPCRSLSARRRTHRESACFSARGYFRGRPAAARVQRPWTRPT